MQDHPSAAKAALISERLGGTTESRALSEPTQRREFFSNSKVVPFQNSAEPRFLQRVVKALCSLRSGLPDGG
jgi:hypothetical protein